MNHRTWILVALLVVIVAMSVVLIVPKRSQAKLPDSSPHLLQEMVMAVDRIQLINEYGELMIKRDQLKWNDAAPFKPIEFDQQKVFGLLSLLAESRNYQSITDRVLSKQDVGLDYPVAMIFFFDDKLRIASLEIGALNPSKTAYYGVLTTPESDDELLVLVPVALAEPAFLSIEDFRSYVVPTVNISAIKTVTVTGDRSFSISSIDTQNYEGKELLTIPFVMISPWVNRPLNELGFSSFLTSIPPIFTVIQYLDGDAESLSLYGLDAPRVTLSLTTDDRDFTVYVGNQADGSSTYIRTDSNDDVLLIQTSQLGFLQFSPTDLVSTFMYLLDISHLDSFVLQTSHRTLEGQIKLQGNAASYLLNGEEVKEDTFKEVFMLLIGLHMVPTMHNGDGNHNPLLSLNYALKDGQAVEISVFEKDDRSLSVRVTSPQSQWFGAIVPDTLTLLENELDAILKSY